MKKTTTILPAVALAVFCCASSMASDKVMTASVGAASTTSSPCMVSLSQTEVQSKPYQVGQTIVNAPPEKVWEVLSDYSNAHKIFSYLKKCRKVADKGKSIHLEMTAATGVGPITVDYVLEITPSNNNRLDFHRVSGAFKSYEGFWELTPVDGGKRTQVTYAKYVDGGFFLPERIVRKAVKDSIPKTLSELKAHTEKTNLVVLKP